MHNEDKVDLDSDDEHYMTVIEDEIEDEKKRLESKLIIADLFIFIFKNKSKCFLLNSKEKIPEN